ncbi:MAG: isoaspartyl peptidase/L-asparaginase [Planctomycetota bacterium]
MHRPILLTTWPFGDPANRAAWPALAAGGASLDAVEAVCRHVELDPAVESVGYGGLPDSSGSVTLDGVVMQSPSRCGAVCAMTRTRHPVTVARRVMEATPHVLLAGPGADAFARDQGLPDEDPLAPEARTKWEAWVRAGRPPGGGHDTVAALGIDAAGVLSGACSTSGRAWKLPGRVGDSPLPGHGLYVDPERGAAAATGDGELIQGLCSTFLAVDAMGRGATPLDALVEALERIRAAHVLAPEAQVGMIALRPDGAVATAALRPGYASTRARAAGGGGEAGFEVVEPEFVLLA